MNEFIVKAVLLNVVFPSNRAGGAGYSISDLAAMDSVSLGAYIDNLEKQSSVSRADIAKGTNEKSIGPFKVSSVVENLNLLFSYRLAQQKRNKLESELRQINKDLEDAASPAEKQAKMMQRKLELEAQLS